MRKHLYIYIAIMLMAGFSQAQQIQKMIEPIAENEKVAFKAQLMHNGINLLADCVDDTRLLLRSRSMNDKAVYYNLLKIAAKGNLPVDSILEKLAAAHKKKPAAKAVQYTIAPKGSIIVENIATGRKLVNNGNTVMMLRPAKGITFRQSDAKLIDPEGSVVVPKGWTSLEVLNQSETAQAQIAVRQK